MRTVTLLVLVQVAFGAAALAAYMTQPDARLEVEVLDARDPTDSDQFTNLTVRLTNQAEVTVRPTFAVPGTSLMNRYSWTVQEGPAQLGPGEQAVYELSQPAWSGVPVEQDFRVLAWDVDEPDIRGSSGIADVDPPTPRPAVLNPNFRFWIPSMIADHDLPYGWIPFKVLHDEDRFWINGTEGTLELTLELDTSRTKARGTPTDWSMVSLRQRIDFPRTFRAAIDESTRGAFAGGASTVVGMSLTDPHAHNELVILFTEPPTDTDQLARRFVESGQTESVRILVTNRSTTVNTLSIWEESGWSVPTPQRVERLIPAPSQQVGMGGPAVTAAYEKFEIMRPIELKVLIASFPPHENERIHAVFEYAGGPRAGVGPLEGG